MAIVSIKTQQVTFYMLTAGSCALRCRPDHGTRDASRRLRRPREGQGPPLDPLRRCLDAEHAAHHLERHRAARRAAARVCCLTRLRADALRLCGEAVRQDVDRDAGDHFAERRGSGRVLPSGAVRAERGGRRGCSGACRDARPRGRGGRQDGRRGEESRRDNGARDSIAHGVGPQAGKAQDPSRRRARVRRQGARRRKDRPSQSAGRGSQAKGRRQGGGPGDPARHRQGRREIEARRRRRRKGSCQGGPTRKADTAKAASEAKLALEPVSVYISRATQKLYVRRNTHKPWADGGEVFDASIEVPVAIRDPDKPIGTHVFTAMARNDAGLRWSAVTIDNGDDAKDALDRITIPQDALDRIAPTAVPRSSIIVSDEPLSGETNYRTEFIAVLNNQPQGGFVTRLPTDDVAVDSGNYWGDDDSGSLFHPWNSQTGNTRRRGGQYYYQLQRGWW